MKTQKQLDSALRSAARDGRLAAITRLIGEGADVNSIDRDGCTALMKASEKGHYNIVACLLCFDANVNIQNQHVDSTALMLAADKGHVEVVERLLSADADVNLFSYYGETALIYSAYGDKPKIVKLLLDHGADVNAKNSELNTPLLAAASWGKTENFKILIVTPNLEIDAQNIKGETALMFAVENGNPVMVQDLLGRGASIKLKNNKGETVVDLVNSCQNNEVKALINIAVEQDLLENTIAHTKQDFKLLEF